MKRRELAVGLLGLFLVLLLGGAALAQSTSGSIQGTVTDNSGAVVPNAKVTAHNLATNEERGTQSDASGSYLLPALPPGTYALQAQAKGMATQRVPSLVLGVSGVLLQNFKLQVGAVTEEITVTAEAPVLQAGTMTVGSSINQTTVQEIPLNGRHFVDLASLVPGTVVPPVQNGFLTAPLRGQGAFAIITAGQREDTTNFMINGINLNDMANGQITFQPSINTVSEFKIDNSTPSADYGRSSGSTVNIATRSGTNAFHGEAFEFLRNEDLDARNFFNKEFNFDATGKPTTKSPKNSFKRNQFGAALGGPIIHNKTFFFGSYEGLRQRQGLALTASVPSAAQRALVTDPTVKQLLGLVPTVTGGGPDPTKASDAVLLNSAAVAPVDIDQGTGDVSHNFNDSDRLHGYYVFQRDKRGEPNLSGGNIPNAGDKRASRRQIFTLNETHVFTPTIVNEARFGMNRIHITFASDSQLAGQDPSTFGINNGLTGPIGLPHFNVGGIGLQFGGEGGFPQSRGDYTAVLSDALTWQKGRHGLKFGGEVRRFNGNSIGADEGNVTFTNIGDFLGCTNTAGTITCGASRPSGYNLNAGGTHPARVYYNALGLFAMDSWKVTPYFTAEIGLRWEWVQTPTEAVNRSSLFSSAQDWLVQVGTNGFNRPFGQNNKEFQPRVGFSWDLFHNGKTVLRSGYGILYDQLLPGPFIGSGNFPFGVPTAFTSVSNKPCVGVGCTFTSFPTLAHDAAGSLTATSVNPDFHMPYVQSYNLNVQQQLTPSLGMMIGYFGSKGTHLEEDININQIINQVTAARPFPTIAATSPLAAGRGLGNITQRNSTGSSNYNALWVTATKHMGHGLQFDTNYTWSKSLDLNSRNFLGTTFQNALNPRGDYGLSDFDARHHFTFSSVYDLPFKGNRVVSGWRMSGAVTLQSGNPLNVTANKAGITGLTGNANIRPDLVGAIPSIAGSLITTPGSNLGRILWFNGTAPGVVCDPTITNSATAGFCTSAAAFAIPQTGTLFHFGSLGRNTLHGPDFKNVDFSISKTTKITERLSHELRIEAFDLFNHPNFGNPGTSAQVGSTTFGVISSTRGPTGDAGSSRQIQFAMKLIF